MNFPPKSNSSRKDERGEDEAPLSLVVEKKGKGDHDSGHEEGDQGSSSNRSSSASPQRRPYR